MVYTQLTRDVDQHSFNAGPRLRRWPSIKYTFSEPLVCVGLLPSEALSTSSNFKGNLVLLSSVVSL